jgi:hypothetical protein
MNPLIHAIDFNERPFIARMESAGGAQRGLESVKWHREQ